LSTISIIASLALRSPFENVELGVHFLGLNRATLADNLWPAYTDATSGYAGSLFAFSLIFPACTGILAGASMSGDLKSPSKSIPLGTLGAIAFTYTMYVSMAFLLAGSISRKSLKNDLSVMSDIAYFPGLGKFLFSLIN
jgi:amino acid transporter